MEGMRRYLWLLWFVLDLALVIVFAASGRASHEEAATVAGTLQVAWPFLVALAIATLATRGWRTINSVWPWGVVVWLVTALLGMLLRVAVAHGGFALSFQLVTLGVLGLFLLGRRIVTDMLLRNRVKLR